LVSLSVEFPWPHIPGGQPGQRRSGTGRTERGEHDGVRRAGVAPGPAGAGDDSVGSGRNGQAAPVQRPGRFHSRPNRQPPHSLSSGRVAVPDGKPMTGDRPAGSSDTGVEGEGPQTVASHRIWPGINSSVSSFTGWNIGRAGVRRRRRPRPGPDIFARPGSEHLLLACQLGGVRRAWR